jgi:hypothetical protein
MDSPRRRRIGRLLQLAIVAVGVISAIVWISRKTSFRDHVQISTTPTDTAPPAALGGGDMRIVSTDTALALTLRGDRLMAGLSEQMVARIRSRVMTEGRGSEGGGSGAAFGDMIRRTVAGAMGTQLAFPLSDVRQVRGEGGRVFIDRTAGESTELFQNVKIDGEGGDSRFRPEDIDALAEAVRARKAELGQR